MKHKLLNKLLTLALLTLGGVINSVWATDVTYKLTIQTSDFNTTSYAANNGSHSKDAVCTTDGSKTMSVSYTTNQIMQSNSVMQWKKSEGYIYNTTDLGTISSVTVTKSDGSFTTYYGTSEQPSSGTAGSGKGFFKTSVGSATGKTSKIEVVFTISEGEPTTCATPTFSPSAGAVAYGTSVSISCATDDATIYYTTDGSTPTSSSTEYSSAITVNTAQTIKAIAVKDGLTDSEVASAAYTIAAPSAPTFNVAAGAVASGTTVTISGTGTIRYTTNGVDPTSSTGTVYSEPVSIDEACTLKAICVDGGGNASSVTSASYTVVTPVAGYDVDFESVPVAYSDWTMTNIAQGTSDISAHGGTYYGTTSGKSTASIVTREKVEKPETLTFYVSKTTSNTTSSTWYVDVSSNGSDWTNITSQSATSMSAGSWTKVECDIESGGTYYTNVYLRIRYSGSTAVRAIDDITLTEVMPVAAPTFSVSSGIYTTVKSVTISCDTDGASIYYTTDGSTPTSSSTLYSSAVSISESCTLKAIAIKGGDQSNVTSATYVINLPTEYNLATEITSGKHYVIASGNDGTVQVMTDQNTAYRNKTSASVVENVLSASGACELIICGPDADNYYTIYDAAANGYLYASSSSSNDLKTQSTIDNNARWSISIDGTTGVASIVAQGSNSRNTLQYNSGSPRFTCYSSDSQTDVYLFEKDGEATPTENITVGSTGYTTYTTTNAVSLPVGTTAYIVTSIGANSVTLAEKASVPARTPVIIEASAGNYDLTSVVSPESVTGNLLQASDGTVNGDGSTIFALGVGKTGANVGKVGFYLVGSGVQVPAGKAYLVVGGGAKEFLTFDFDDEATSIEETLSNSTLKGENIYNLAGQRIQKMQKGINIVNGKKIAIK